MLLTHAEIDRAAFREAMSHFAAAVSLVTTDGPAGRRGVTVTSVCSVSDDPATLLVCLNRTSAANARFAENGVFAVNVLADRSEPVARAFAGEGKLDLDQRFASGRWTTLETGAPILEDSIVSFDCRILESRTVATHQVTIGQVVGLSVPRAGHSLLYRARRYHALQHLEPE
ncbi:flavin reductase [Aureimonas sp. Leaf324]|uniref:flavin reductase n=1 Tax=Aureimonas sp. Leaf324 TaxID=1736336 RepID=UPI000AB123A9|nr:flavin reductase [Aureimonas sp. Leaf324]